MTVPIAHFFTVFKIKFEQIRLEMKVSIIQARPILLFVPHYI